MVFWKAPTSSSSGRKCLNLSGHKMVFVSCYHTTTATSRRLSSFSFGIRGNSFFPSLGWHIGNFYPMQIYKTMAIKPIKSGHYRNSPCQPMECNTSRLRIRAYYVFNARTELGYINYLNVWTFGSAATFTDQIQSNIKKSLDIVHKKQKCILNLVDVFIIQLLSMIETWYCNLSISRYKQKISKYVCSQWGENWYIFWHQSYGMVITTRYRAKSSISLLIYIQSIINVDQSSSATIRSWSLILIVARGRINHGPLC